MPVHANSVIDVRINTVDSILYTKVTDQENDAFIADEPLYLSEFTNMNAALLAWLDDTRGSKMRDFIQGIYQYKLFNVQFSTNFTLESQLDSASVFDMGGERAIILGRALGYYTTGDTANLIAETGAITTGTATESTNITALTGSMLSVIKAEMDYLLFNDVVSSGTISKTDLGNYIYGSVAGELGYKIATTKFPNLGIAAPSYVP